MTKVISLGGSMSELFDTLSNQSFNYNIVFDRCSEELKYNIFFAKSDGTHSMEDVIVGMS